MIRNNSYDNKDQRMPWQYRLIKDIFSTENNNCSLSMMNDSKLSDIKSKHCPYRLFKYYAPTIENVSDVQNRLLWLASPESFNDPYDCYLTFNSDEFWRYYTIKSFRNQNIFSKELQRIIYSYKNELFSYYFSQLAESSNNKRLKKFEETLWKKETIVRDFIRSKMSNRYRIACFSSYTGDLNNYELLMWAHYAQSHKGFCVEYDITPLFDNEIKDENILPFYSVSFRRNEYLNSLELRKLLINGFFPVQYSSKMIEIPKTLCYAISKKSCSKKQACDININAFKAVITKQLPWKYEREWRLVVDSDISKRVKHKIPFPFATKIYVGKKASDELKRILTDTAKLLDIPTNVF